MVYSVEVCCDLVSFFFENCGMEIMVLFQDNVFEFVGDDGVYGQFSDDGMKIDFSFVLIY